MPLYTISSGYHEHDSAHVDHLHQGIDFAVPPGTPVHTLKPGVVVNVTHDAGGFGNSVWVQFKDGYTAVYGHLQNVNVHIGEKVSSFEVIGASGSTGNSTGPHLHFGVMDPSQHWVDPNIYMMGANHPVVKIGGQVVQQATDPNTWSGLSQQWKGNVEDWGHYLFGIPQSAWEWGSPKAPDATFTNELAQHIANGVGEVCKELGRMLLHMAPDILLVVCMGCILGMMIGSERCKHWASVSALATLVFQVVNKFV